MADVRNCDVETNLVPMAQHPKMIVVIDFRKMTAMLFGRHEKNIFHSRLRGDSYWITGATC